MKKDIKNPKEPLSDSLMNESNRKKYFAAQQEKIGSALVKKGMGDKPMGTVYVNGKFESVPTGKQRLEIARKAKEEAKKDSINSVKLRIKKTK
jgi:hypothetical protein